VKRCAILDDYQNIARSLADWKSLPDVETTVFSDYIPTHEKRVEALKDFDIIVAMRERTPFDAALLKALPKLRLLITTGHYNSSFDLAQAEAQGITLSGTGGVNGVTAELTWALILALTRSVFEEVRDFKASAKWQPRVSHDVTGKRLGVLGFGRLGSRVSRVGVAFDMDVIAWTPNLTEDRVKTVGAKLASSVDEIMSTSDYISIHIPLNPKTRGLIGKRELGLMKPTAFIVNTSRGPIIDEDALIEALEGEKIAGAAVDVYAQEPLPPDHRLRKIERLIGTPHIGYVTEENYKVYYRDIVEDIAAWLKGAPIRPIAARK
jgi:phosphoglycerate dehydrogenase-like enzyme